MTDDHPASEEPEDRSAEEFVHSDRGPGARPTAPGGRVPPPIEAPADDAGTPGTAGAADDGAEPEVDAEAAVDPGPGGETTDDATVEGSTDGSTTVLEAAALTADAPPATPRSPVVVALALATAVLFVTTVLFGLMAFAPRLAPIKSGPAKLAAKAQEEEGIEAVARRFATNFVSIDYETIDADLDKMEADATSAFAEKLRRTIEVIGEQFKKRKASSSGRALDAAVISHTDDSALVQVLLRRTKENVGTEGPETGNQIVNVTLVKTPDGWKVDDLSQLGAEDQ